MVDVVLRPGKERLLLRRHPWVLSGAIEKTVGAAEPGAWTRVVSAAGETLGFGHLSPNSKLRVRVLAFGKESPPDDLVERRIAAAVARRDGNPLIGETDAVRLVNAEGDGLPGLVVDRYADVVIVKIMAAGMAARRAAIGKALRGATRAPIGFERADSAAARREAIPAQQGPLWGPAPPDAVPIRERDRRYGVDVVGGQKTGFYLDQRDARDLVRSLASGRRVLDLFAYTGGFAVAAALGGASSITLVDSSAAALALARANLAKNGADARIERADAFDFVRRDQTSYDLLVIDPPPLARARHDVARASRAYKDVLLFALRRAEPGALLLTFACSHHVGAELFRKIAFSAALDAGRDARVLRTLGPPADHPVSIAHPEGAYLTGLLLEV